MTKLPATVANLDHDMVIEALSRNACNVSAAAADLGVPPSDLRRLMWSNPRLQDQAFEVSEARIDKAEKNIAEGLHSEDPRMRMAAAFFVLRNSVRAKRRGWITSSSAAAGDGTPQTNQPVVFKWRDKPDDPGHDAEVARLREEGQNVVSIGWGSPDDKTDFIERDGNRIPVPRYGARTTGRGDGVIEGELATPRTLIEHDVEPAPAAIEPEPIAAEPEPVDLAPAVLRAERARVDAWISKRVIPWDRGFCLRCQRPIAVGAEWVDVVGDDGRARLHRVCRDEWREEARRALGLG